MYINKSKYNEISFDFIIPKNYNGKLIIILPGLPEYPRPKEIMIKLADKGYSVIYPKYRGTFESKGSFLEKSPAYDILELIDYISHYGKIIDLFFMKEVRLNINEIIVLASSFGSSVGLHLAKLTNKVKKFVLIAPVIDFASHNNGNNEQDLENLGRFIKRGYPFIYRFKEGNYKRLLKGNIIPSALDKIKSYSGKIVIVHGEDDEVVSLKNSINFVSKFPSAELIKLKGKGHFSVSNINEELLNGVLK